MVKCVFMLTTVNGDTYRALTVNYGTVGHQTLRLPAARYCQTQPPIGPAEHSTLLEQMIVEKEYWRRAHWSTKVTPIHSILEWFRSDPGVNDEGFEGSVSLITCLKKNEEIHFISGAYMGMKTICCPKLRRMIFSSIGFHLHTGDPVPTSILNKRLYKDNWIYINRSYAGRPEVL